MSTTEASKRVVDPRLQAATDLINQAVGLAGDEDGALDLLVMATSELAIGDSELCNILLRYLKGLEVSSNFSCVA